jgi:hypothetical protein
MDFPASVYARYHRGTHGAEGRGCGKVFSGSRRMGSVVVRVSVWASLALLYPASPGLCVSISWAYWSMHGK